MTIQGARDENQRYEIAALAALIRNDNQGDGYRLARRNDNANAGMGILLKNGTF